MEELINRELAALQEELKSLSTAVKHISDAERIASGLVENTKAIQGRYEGYLEESHNLYKQVSTSHQGQINEVQKILSKYLELAEVTTKLSKEFKQLNLEGRMSNLETRMTGVESSVKHMDTNVNMMQGQMTQLQTVRQQDVKQLRSHSVKLSTITWLVSSTILLTGASLFLLIKDMLAL